MCFTTPRPSFLPDVMLFLSLDIVPRSPYRGSASVQDLWCGLIIPAFNGELVY
jgi:hypothetical protein